MLRKAGRGVRADGRERREDGLLMIVLRTHTQDVAAASFDQDTQRVIQPSNPNANKDLNLNEPLRLAIGPSGILNKQGP